MRFGRVVRGVVLVLGVVGLVPVAAGAQSTGPRFTGEFQRGYDAGAPIDASGAGCPATGGPPSATPPGVFVGSHNPNVKPRASDVGVEITVEGGQVVVRPDPFSAWTGIYDAIFFPVNADGTWTGVMPHGLAAAGLEPDALAGLCTTLLRLTEDGQSIDPASIEEAIFVSPAFCVWVIPYQPSTTTTTTSTTSPWDTGRLVQCHIWSTTTTTTSTTSPSAPAVQANPRFTG